MTVVKSPFTGYQLMPRGGGGSTYLPLVFDASGMVAILAKPRNSSSPQADTQFTFNTASRAHFKRRKNKRPNAEIFRISLSTAEAAAVFPKALRTGMEGGQE